MLWMTVFDQSFPAGLAIPSPLKVLAMSRMLFPDSAILNMRCTTGAVLRLDFQLGPLLSPVLHVHLPVAIGGVRSDPEAA